MNLTALRAAGCSQVVGRAEDALSENRKQEAACVAPLLLSYFRAIALVRFGIHASYQTVTVASVAWYGC